jgi:uncharacterized protein YbjT (DUF2867 family)
VAARRAAAAQPGDVVGVAGPRGSFVLERQLDWQLFVGDETAQPEFARRLEELPADTRAMVVSVVDGPGRAGAHPRVWALEARCRRPRPSRAGRARGRMTGASRSRAPRRSGPGAAAPSAARAHPMRRRSSVMYIVLGATGHVGSAVASSLLDRGVAVTVVTRDRQRAEPHTRRGAIAAVTDIHDVEVLRGILRTGRRAFLLMPPADPSTDTVAVERRSVAAIARAVEGSGLEKVVVQSTYGAQPGDGLGDLGVLHELEQAVAATGVATSVVRGAYYMSNWDGALETARDHGTVSTFFPVDLALPMVAPQDLGREAARLLTDEAEPAGVRHVEGPSSYTPRDVARAFAAVLGREVTAVETPRSAWAESLQAMGFSPPAAASYARMMAITVDGRYERPARPTRGPTPLLDYVTALSSRST